MQYAKEQPLVSVIIPCYNQARFLGEAIESVLNQTYRNFEIIVIDDGSPDNASEVASRRPEVRLIKQKNQGISAARNRGIRESRGDFLLFLDSDDLLKPNALEANLKCMSEKPESALVFGRFHWIWEDGRLGTQPSILHEGDLYYGLLHYNCIGMVAPVLYRREIFEVAGDFDSRFNSAEDYHLYLRIAREFPTHRHSEVIAYYRVHDSGASNNLGRMLRSAILALKTQRPFVNGDPMLEKAYSEGLKFWRKYYGEELYINVSKRLFDPRRIKDNLIDLWHLIRFYPQLFTIHGGSRWNKFKDRVSNSFRSAGEQKR